MTRLTAATALGTRRAMLIPPLLFAATWFAADSLLQQIDLGRVAGATATDMAMWVLADYRYLLLVLGLGFVVLVGDHIPRTVGSGLAALTAVRAGGRVRWWTGQVLGFGVLAVLLVTAALGAALLVGALRLPPSTVSLPATPLMNPDVHLIPIPAGLSRPALLAVTVLLVAGVLWIHAVVCAVLALVRPHPVLATLPVVAWILVDNARFASGRPRPTGISELNPHERMNVASYTDVGREVVENPALSPLVTALTLGAVLGALLLLGVVRLWRADLPGRS